MRLGKELTPLVVATPVRAATRKPPLISALDFFVLRVPALPVGALRCLEGGSGILEFFRHPLAREALSIATASLYERLCELERRRGAKMDDSRRKLESSLAKYALRMCTRPTPFGLFAGIVTGSTAGATSLSVGDANSVVRHSSAGPTTIYSICSPRGRLANALAPHLRWYPNPTLYRVAGEWRYVERVRTGAASRYLLSAVPDEPAIGLLTRAAENGATLDLLRGTLMSAVDGASAVEIDEFLRDVTESGILLSELDPPIPGIDPLEHVNGLASAQQHLEEARALTAGLNALKELDSEPSSERLARHESATNAFRAMQEHDDRLPICVVGVRSAPGISLKTAVADDIAGVAADLLSVEAIGNHEDYLLVEFRRQFTLRYESRWQPLLEVLDAENGIGFGAARIEAPFFEGGFKIDPLRATTSTERGWDALLIRLLENAWTNDLEEVTVTAEDLATLPRSRLPTPGTTLAALVSLVAKDSAALDAGAYSYVLHGVGGRSSADLLTRFCYADEVLHNHVRKVVDLEQARSPDTVLAECCCVPHGRTANVAGRPGLRSYEIPCGVLSSLPRDRQILPNELLVAVQQGRVVLYSRRLQKLVKPMWTTAANLSKGNVPLYQFLEAVAWQGARHFRFAWPSAVSKATFLPRLRYGRAILKPRQWRLHVAAHQGQPIEEYVAGMRARYAIPDVVVLRSFDEALPCDLRTQLGMDCLLKALRSSSTVTIEESFIDTTQCVVAPDGTYTNEAIIPMIVNETETTSGLAPTVRAPTRYAESLPTKVSMPPGTRWIYVKLYGGKLAVDKLLVTEVRRALADLAAAGRSTRWFFVRYGDPDWHLRLRVCTPQISMVGEVRTALENMAADLASRGTVWRVQFDTYEPEIERYGGYESMAHCEALFHRDSECVLGMLEGIISEADSTGLRWRAALLGVHWLLTDFHLDAAARHDLVTALSSMSDTRRVGLEEALISRTFRKSRAELSDLIEGQTKDAALRNCIAMFGRRSRGTRGSIDALRQLEQAGSLWQPLTDIVASVVHMFTNRIMLESDYMQESMIYALLERLYRAELALARPRETHARIVQPSQPTTVSENSR